MARHKLQIADVTNLQSMLRYPLEPATHQHYCETRLHRRYFSQHGLYLATVLGEQLIWDEGKPEWQRNTTGQNVQIG